ncbi:MAG: DNA-binding response regulator [Burkholderiales bacterium PBB4]|nr:MAG: DNA-binding response regulator [Burkholderiales bacterium PBB4]
MSAAPLRILIVDDEPLARGLIREYLVSHPEVSVVGESAHGLQAVQDIAALAPDLIFLDIQMPKLTGLEVLELTGRRSGVIFTTADDQHALKAFDLHAVDYLLKPFSQARFDDALERACQALMLESRSTAAHSAQALNGLMAEASQRPARILIRDRNQVHVIAVNKVEYVQAQDDYISIQSGGKSYLKTQTLAELATQLDPAQFVRVHRSYLLNLDYLQSLERSTKDSFVAVLQSGQKIPISRAGYERLGGLMDGTA